MQVFYDVSYFCTVGCPHCCTNSSTCHGHGEMRGLQLEKVLQFISSYAKKISISGGEPFLHNDIYYILRYLSEKISVSLTTTTTGFSPDKYEHLDYKNINVTISLDSLLQETIRIIKPGLNFTLFIKNFHLINNLYNGNISARTTINALNKNEVFEIIDFCENNGVQRLKVNTTNIFGRGKDQQNIILPFTEFKIILSDIEEYVERKNYNLIVELPIKKNLTTTDSETMGTCLLGNNSIFINPTGKIFACSFCDENIFWGDATIDDPEKILQVQQSFNHDTETCRICPINRYKNEKA
ncbi:MAG: radical SAM protein [Clostridium sp.]|jgi:MoaA/NifB/PqqE/SkfB family radical SAM enzyme|nr:radical SAM protein [Clostridium sp.]